MVFRETTFSVLYLYSFFSCLYAANNLCVQKEQYDAKKDSLLKHSLYTRQGILTPSTTQTKNNLVEIQADKLNVLRGKAHGQNRAHSYVRII